MDRLQSAAREGGLLGNRRVLLGPCRAYFTTTEGGTSVGPSLAVVWWGKLWPE